MIGGAMDAQRPAVTEFVHIGLLVEDLDETVRFLELLRGPEGLIVELAEKLGGAPD
jgi:hypothetical protein